MTVPITSIKTVARPTCPICNRPGVFLYEHLTDTLFNSPGEWSMKRCPNTHCQTIWLDPTPAEEELGKLYATYSTHVNPINPNTKENYQPRKLIDFVRTAVRFKKLGYANTLSVFANNFLYGLSHLHPAWQDTQSIILFYLPAKQAGKLLDIGCGNGSSMLVMRNQGWDVSGIDFDKQAIAQAQTHNLNATVVASLDTLDYQDNSFDAIMLNHVIEHVPQPIKLVQECFRVLKPSGTLVALTPNATSLGHQKFKSNWRGLETPRHLQVFTRDSLALLAKNAAFGKIDSFTSTQGILQIYDESAYYQKNHTSSLMVSSRSKLAFHLRWLLAGWRHRLFPTLSEVVVLRCFK